MLFQDQLLLKVLDVHSMHNTVESESDESSSSNSSFNLNDSLSSIDSDNLLCQKMTKTLNTRNNQDNKKVLTAANSDLAFIDRVSSMLDEEGGLRKFDTTFLKYFDESSQLPVQCMVINILKSTQKSTIKKLLSENLWSVLCKWLTKAIEPLNRSLVLELLQLFKFLPITTELMKSNSCAKEIKQLRKSRDSIISRLSGSIVDEWMNIVKSSNETKPIIEVKKKTAPINPRESTHSLVNTTSAQNVQPVKNLTESSNKNEMPKKRPRTTSVFVSKLRSTGLESVESDKKNEIVNDSSKAAIIDQSSKEIFSFSESLKMMTYDTNKNLSKTSVLSDNSLFSKAINGQTNTFTRKKKPTAKNSFPVSTILMTEPVMRAPELTGEEIAKVLREVNKRECPDVNHSCEPAAKRVKLEEPVGNKKCVSWKADDELCQYSYFESDPDERTNVWKTNYFSEDFNKEKKQELLLEGKALHGHVCDSDEDDENVNLKQWKCPERIERIDVLSIQSGSDSKEKVIQAERQSIIQPVLYFNKESIPDFPGEPDEVEEGNDESVIRILFEEDDESISANNFNSFNRESNITSVLDYSKISYSGEVAAKGISSHFKKLDQFLTPTSQLTGYNGNTIPFLQTSLTTNGNSRQPNIRFNCGNVERFHKNTEPNNTLVPYNGMFSSGENQMVFNPNVIEKHNTRKPAQPIRSLFMSQNQFKPFHSNNDVYSQQNGHQTMRHPGTIKPRFEPYNPSSGGLRQTNIAPLLELPTTRPLFNKTRLPGVGKQLCQFHLAGKCKFGEHCRNIH